MNGTQLKAKRIRSLNLYLNHFPNTWSMRSIFFENRIPIYLILFKDL